MPRLSDRERMLRGVTEADLERLVTALARENGWMAHHERRSTYSTGDQGFPDWVFARPGRLVIAELKRETEEPWEKQERWLDTLGIAGPAEVHVWRPSDWYDGRIKEVLGGYEDDEDVRKKFRVPELRAPLLPLQAVQPRPARGLRARHDGRR